MHTQIQDFIVKGGVPHPFLKNIELYHTTSNFKTLHRADIHCTIFIIIIISSTIFILTKLIIIIILSKINVIILLFLYFSGLQVGNAVPPPLAKAIGSQIKKAIEKKNE